MRLHTLIPGALVSTLLALRPLDVQAASFQGLGDLPGGAYMSLANKVSGNGLVVVGNSTSASKTWEAYRWTQAEGMVPLGDPPGAPVYGSGAGVVNSDGSVIGGDVYTTPDLLWSGERLLRWTSAGGSVNLGCPPSLFTRGYATGVSADGNLMAVGSYNAAGNYQAYTWSEATGYVFVAADLPGGLDTCPAWCMSADGLVLAGVSYSAAGREAYRWSAATGVSVGLGDLAGGDYASDAYGCSSDGGVIVGQGTSASGTEAFRWTEATGMVGLSDLPGGTFESRANDTSADGEIVVGYGNTDSGREAFIWDAVHGMRRLADVLVGVYGLDLTGWTLTEANGVSDDGRVVVGSGLNPSGNQEGWIADLDALPLSLAQVRDCQGTTVLVPVTARGFTGIGSLQLTIEWDPDVATYDGVEQLGLPDLGAENFGTPEAGKLTLSWEDVGLEGTTLPDDSTLFAVRLALTGSRGATCRVFISDGPTVAEATTADYQLLEVTATEGRIEIIPDLTISGGVAYYQDAHPVSAVSLVLTGDDNQTIASDVAGLYDLTVLPCGSYHVRAEKLTHTPANEGVTAADVLKIRRQVLGLEPLTPPFELLASDANASRTITSMDIRLIRQLILDLRDDLPAGLWRFVNADHVFPDPSAPWDAPGSRDYPDLRVDASGQDYIGIKIGDANGSWAPPPSFLALRQAIRTMAAVEVAVEPVCLKVGSELVQVGKEVELAIRVDAVADLTTLQFTVTWDPACLRFRSIARHGLRGLGPDNFGTHRVQEGRLTFAWDDPQGRGVKLAGGEGVFSLRFEALGPVGRLTTVRLEGTPTVIEATVGGVVIATECRAGAVLLTSSERTPRLQCKVEGNEQLQLAVEGPAGAVAVVEFSTDLMRWTPVSAVAPIVLTDEAVAVKLPEGVAAAAFYRLSFVDAALR